MYEKIRKSAMESQLVKDIFHVVDDRLATIYTETLKNQDKDIIDELSREWRTWFSSLKYVSGTSTGFNMFGEYAVFQLIRHHIETKFNLKMKASEKNLRSTKDVWTFIDDQEPPQIILAHGSNLKLEKNKTYRPDISLWSYEDQRLLAVWEVKVLFSSSSVFNDAVEILTRVKQQKDCKIYLVVLDDKGPSPKSCKIEKLNSSGVVFVGPRGARLEVTFNLSNFEKMLSDIDEFLSAL